MLQEAALLCTGDPGLMHGRSETAKPCLCEPAGLCPSARQEVTEEIREPGQAVFKASPCKREHHQQPKRPVDSGAYTELGARRCHVVVVAVSPGSAKREWGRQPGTVRPREESVDVARGVPGLRRCLGTFP